MQDSIPASLRKQQPTFLSAERVSGRTDLQTRLEGGAELRRADTVIRADTIEYDQPQDTAHAAGHVHINRAGNTYEGPALNLKVEAFQGEFDHPSYHFLKNDASGSASRIDFQDERHMVVHDATFSTCRRKPGPDWLPDWVLKASSIQIDNDIDEGRAQDAVLYFKGAPLLPFPDISFPLSEQRKTGFLPPAMVVDNLNGVEITQPFYWNIAPNRDITFLPTLMTKRGVNLGSDFRYLETDYRGEVRADYMPSDSLRGRSRWGFSAQHNSMLNASLAGLPLNSVALNLNRVSDDNYWTDFPHTTTNLTQRLLPNDAVFMGSNDNWATTLRMLKWQTLQNPLSPIVAPYDRLPELMLRYQRPPADMLNWSVEGDYTYFQNNRAEVLQPNAQRAYVQTQLSLPLRTPGWYVEPKLMLHSTHYQFDSPLSASGATTATRHVPTFSLDSGLVFERDTQWLGRALRQTLEPRAFYVHTPFRDQSQLPNYDSGLLDFNFATLYSPNAFAGNDRISDSHQLTLGLTSRLLNPFTGAESARFGVAQRLRFHDQSVTLPTQTLMLGGQTVTQPGSQPVTGTSSDFLVGTTLNWTPQWMLDSLVQFDPNTHAANRTGVSMRYNPGNYRIFSFGYRYQRDQSEQIDMGWQWPLNGLWGEAGQDLGPGRGLGDGQWYGVGRMNFSLKDGKMVNSLYGFEYDAGCWLGRVVLERLQRPDTTTNTRLLFQLEFVGFSRVGASPLQSLKQNIPRYQLLREQVTPPSRYGNYD